MTVEALPTDGGSRPDLFVAVCAGACASGRPRKRDVGRCDGGTDVVAFVEVPAGTRTVQSFRLTTSVVR